MGTIPDAIAAAEPPLEPPALYSKFHGLWVAPKSRDSEEVDKLNSGVWVLPRMTSPACLRRTTISESWSGMKLRKMLEPKVVIVPAYNGPISLSRNGTPENGPEGNPAAIAAFA
jgi:hypothetical protein